ncbi:MULTISPECIES: hypothetical protein [Larsenimonas]|uniref:Uncharacterized protein n=1 Tax=Larsenimonas suaedae TaxID=1851019 RepID=A0ABU1GWR1_9GAMM|nr:MULTISPECIES: hypothetical protein [Larsenimonas]MCM2973011.1 hypothetical protein [Larsenimonas suaedae]MCM5704966.1 hypothetical protein [Larsenimonas salina]MDR5896448.1 hypothetical protein [Larsenimonas suaedae]
MAGAHKAFLLILAIATLWMALLAGGGQSIGAGAIIFMVWGVSPYLLLWTLKRYVLTDVAPRALLALIALVGVTGLYAYADVLFLNPRNDGGFTFLITPFVQWIMVVLGGGALYWLKRRRRD